MCSYEMTSLLKQIDEQKDHMIVAMNILMFLIRHQVVLLNLLEPKESQLAWDKCKLNLLCSQAAKLVSDDESSGCGSTNGSSSSESLSTEASSLDMELVK